MRAIITISAACAAILTAGCEPAGPTVRFAAPPAIAEQRVGIAYSTVAVRDVSLPTYAALEEISVDLGAGRIETVDEGLWADDPVRAVTLALTGVLGGATRATVAPEPWPFESEPEAAVDVRFETFVAEAAGRFVASGQYFVAPSDEERPERARAFALTIPYDPATGLRGIARARSQAIEALGLLIARDGLR